MKAWRLSVALAAFLAALALAGLAQAWSPDWGNGVLSYTHFWGGGPYPINWFGNPGDNNNGVETYAMAWQARQQTDLPSPGGKVLREPCQVSPWPYNIYVSGSTLVFRQGTGCEWYDPATGRWSGRMGNDRFPYLFTNSPVPDGEAFALEFLWRYMDYQPHGAGLTLNNRGRQAIFQVWADTGLTGHESFRLQGREVLALPNLGHEYFVRFEYHTGRYVLYVQDRWTGQWYGREGGASISPDGANLLIGNNIVTAGVDTWVSFYVGNVTFYQPNPRLWITSVSPASPQRIGSQVDITARMVHAQPINNVQFYVNTASDGSPNGSWVRLATQLAPSGWQDLTATARWDTTGWSPGNHLVVVNGYTAKGTLLPWNEDKARQYVYRIGPSPSLCITGVEPASPQAVGASVKITARLQHYEELDRIDFYVNNATDGSANGAWTLLGSQYAPAGAWDFTASVTADTYWWYWGSHLLVANGFTRSGSRLVWNQEACRQQRYQVGPSPYLAITGYSPNSPAPVGATITFWVRLKHYDYLDRIDFYVNQASDGSSSGAWTFLGSARPSGDQFDYTGTATWNTSGLSPGSYLVVVNGWTRGGRLLAWNESPSRQVVFRLGPNPYLCITGLSPGSPQPVGARVTVSARMQHYQGVSRIAFWVNQASDGSASGPWTYLGYQAAPAGSTDFSATVTWDTAGWNYGDHLVVVNGWARDGSWMGYGPCSSYVYRVGPGVSLAIQGVSPPNPQPVGTRVNITARMAHWEYVKQVDFYANEAADGSSNGAWRLLGSASPSGSQFEYTARVTWDTSGWSVGGHLIAVNGYSRGGRAYYWNEDASRWQTYTLGPGASLSIAGISPANPQPVGALVNITARMSHWEYVARIEVYANEAADGSASGAWRLLGALSPSGSQFDYTGNVTWNTAGWPVGTHLIAVDGYSKAGTALYWYQDGGRQARYTLGPVPSLCLGDVSPASPQPIGTQVRFSGRMAHYSGVQSITAYVNTAPDSLPSGSWVKIGEAPVGGSMDYTASFTWDTRAWAAGTYLLVVEGRASDGSTYGWAGDGCRQVRYTIGPAPALALAGASPPSPQPVGTLVALSAQMSHYQGVDRIEFYANEAADGSPSSLWRSLGTAYGAGAMDFQGSVVWNTGGWPLGVHLVVANGYSKGGDSLLWTGDRARQMGYTLGNPPALLITEVEPPSPQVVGTRVRIAARMEHYQHVERIEFLVNEAQDGSASGPWRRLGEGRPPGNVFAHSAEVTWDSAGWAPGAAYLIAVNGYTREGALLVWDQDPRRQARYRLLVQAQPPTVLPLGRHPVTGVAAGPNIAWVVGKPMDLILSGRITPPPFAESVAIQGFTYRGRRYGPDEPVGRINRLQGWDRPRRDAIDYTLWVSTRYRDGQVRETAHNLRINVEVAYPRISQ